MSSPEAAPLVSVIMPAYNAAAFIGESIRSVLSQTCADLELIIIDDASTDDTAAIVRAVDDPRVVLVQLPRNGGVVRARNAGVARARGRYVALLDADDLAMPQRLETQLACMQQQGADVCASAYQSLNMVSGRVRGGHQYLRDVDLKALLTVYCPVGNSTVMGKIELFKRCPYDPAFTYAEDYELWTRMAAQGAKLAAVPDVLMTYRLHPGQSSVSNNQRVQAASDAVRTAYLQRLGINAAYAPRKLPWRERLRVAPRFLRILRARFGPVSVGANYEIYARFQFRGNGLVTPVVRLERLAASLWARYGPVLRLEKT